MLQIVMLTAFAQQQPLMQKGTVIDYRFFLYGQTVPVKLTVQSVEDSVQLDWLIRGATGSYLISGTGLEKGTKINFVQPAYQKTLRLAPDETFAIISKAAFAALKRDKQFVYNQTTYQLKPEQTSSFQLGNQAVQVLHVVGKEESAELWILDNPLFPLICQMKNNPLGINFTVLGIK